MKRRTFSRRRLARNMLSLSAMDVRQSDTMALRDAEAWLALGAGTVLLLAGAARRSIAGACLAAGSVPLLYRGITGDWPPVSGASTRRRDGRLTLAGGRGLRVRESVRLEVPRSDVYGFWRRLENLPRVMTHLNRVSESPDGTSHWVAVGPAGLAVEWDAEIVDDVEDTAIVWRSIPGSDIVSVGSVSFQPARDGRSTEVRLDLRYDPPAGRAGALVASLFGLGAAFTIREDLRRLKQLLEAGETARATAAG